MKTNSSRSVLLLGTALLGVAFGLTNQAHATSAWELSTVTGYRNDSWSFGEIFTVGATSITIDALGALDVGGNGFVTAGGVQVGLFKESDASLIVSTTVTSADSLVGNYRFASIASVVLAAGEQYRVVGVNGDDLYNIAYNPNIVTDSRITWNGYGYGNSTSLVFSNDWSGTEISWFANMNIAGSTNVPDGGSSLALVGLGLCGLVALRRRR